MTFGKSTEYLNFLAALVASNFADEEMRKAMHAATATIEEIRGAFAIAQARRAEYLAIYNAR